MSQRLPVLSWKKAIQIFERMGYTVVRQTGSHFRLHHPSRDPLTIPRHPIIGRGLLRKLIRDAQCTLEEFRRYCELRNTGLPL